MDTQESYLGSDDYDATPTVGATDTAEIPTVDAGSSRKGRSGSASGKGSTNADAPVQAVVQQAQDTAGQVVTQAQETAGKVVDQVRETASSQLSSQKDRVAEAVGTVAQVIRSAGDQLKGQDQSAIAQYADTAAQRVDQFSNYLQNKDVREIASEVEHFARRQPTLFLAGAFAVGLLGARFLKSSGQQAQQGGSSSGYSGGYSGGYGRQQEGQGSYGGQQAASYSSQQDQVGYSPTMGDAPVYGERGYEAADMEG